MEQLMTDDRTGVEAEASRLHQELLNVVHAWETQRNRADAAEAELERLRAELRRWDGHEALTATLIKQAEAERDHYRERLAETDQGAVILALEETVAAADADRDRLEAERDALKALLRDLVDPDDCSRDHRGGCQAHGYLALKPTEECPHAEARHILAALDHPTENPEGQR